MRSDMTRADWILAGVPLTLTVVLLLVIVPPIANPQLSCDDNLAGLLSTEPGPEECY